MRRYNPKEIEQKWQAKWEADKIYQASENPDRPKKYVLEYFPYPSGAAMHVGHVRNYTIGDAIARFNRMNGYNVLHPMGWDAFGLPAENYAIKHKVSPCQAIDENTARFKQQLVQMGFSYDWSREIDSTDPKYYKWTQWFFLMLFNKGLAYQKESLQWWCPVDKTVLANEQVENGRCWRCGNAVEKKSLKQWFFKITEYADRLLDDLDDLDWSTSIKSMQRNWIGRKEGINITYKVANAKSDETITVFTTRPDTNYGATFVVLAPEHEFVRRIMSREVVPDGGPPHWQAVQHYVQKSLAKSDIERQEEGRLKTGAFTGLYVKNPLNGKKLPIWVSDFVLANFGTGAVVGVPGHDMRDFQFAKQFDLPVVRVVEGEDGDTSDITSVDQVQEKVGKMVNSGELDGMNIREATEKMKDLMEEAGMGQRIVSYSIRDWLISRQRYWGAPIPIVHCPACLTDEIKNSAVATIDFADHKNFLHLLDGTKTAITRAKTAEYAAIKDRDIIKLTDNSSDTNLYATVFKTRFYGNIHNLYEDPATTTAAFVKPFESEQALREQYENSRPGYAEALDRDGILVWEIEVVKSPVAVPEDQLPVVLPEVESYEPSGDGRSPLANVPEFVNTTCPQCGGPAERETDTMDGFACSSWYFLRFADPHNDAEPFDKAKADFWLPVDDYIGGAEHAVMHLLYARFWTKVMYDEKLIDFSEPFTTLRNQGMILAPDGQKMSKSKGNTIEPDGIIEQGYGADSIRIMELFIGPWNQSANWSVEGMGGSFRFLQRVWTLVNELLEAKPEGSQEAELTCRTMHKAVKKVTADLETLSFNTAIAALMEAVNELYKAKAEKGFEAEDWHVALSVLIQLLAPFAPHISEELWQQLGHEDSIHLSQWPKHDEKYLIEDTVTIAIQVNGKLRGEIEVTADVSENDAIEAAKTNKKVASYLEGATIRKTIYVPGRLVNFVI